jgi:hypothetical protein
MTSTDDLHKKMAVLPEPVLEYLYSEDVGDLNDQIISRNQLNEEQTSKLFSLLRELFVRTVPFGNMEAEIEKRFSFDRVKAKRLALDIAGYRLLPLDRWLGDVSGYVRRLGGVVADYPPDRVQMSVMTRDEAAAEVVNASSAVDTSSRARVKMQDVVTSFLAGVRTEAQALEMLSRSDKIGGVGLDPDAAKKIIDQAKEEARAVIIKEESPGVQTAGTMPDAWTTDDELSLTLPVSAEIPAIKDDFQTIKPEDEKEIERVKEEVLPAKGADQADDTARKIELAVDRIYLASGLKTDDEAMQKRIKTVIGNRLRDVRDQMETLETMVQPKELGGLSLSQDAARALLTAIQASLKEVHDTHAEQTQDEKAQWVRTERLKEAEAPAKEAAADRSELENMFQSIVAKSAKAQHKIQSAASATPPAAQSAPGVPTPGLQGTAPKAPVVAPPNLPVADTNPVPPDLRPPAVPPLPLPASATVVTPPMTMPTKPPLTLVRPMPGEPVRPPSTLRGPGQTERPRMEDVKAAPRLTGPVEELRALTVIDFRRLSKDPKEASMKVKDKIDLLAEQSYTHRTEGISAWSASEVVQTYLDLMRESLNGIPLTAAIAARQSAKKPFLTQEEFQAVSELSRQLRY